MTNVYGPWDLEMRPLFMFKLGLVKRAQYRWPRWVAYEEDIALRKPMWNIRLREQDGEKFRVVMWDMTGVMTCKFGASNTLRATYSKYYAGNCVKGGIFIQPC